VNTMKSLLLIAAITLLCFPAWSYAPEGERWYSDACSSKCPAPGGITSVSFKPSDFPFVTTVQDDGRGKAAGWQEAKVNLEFTRVLIPRGVKTWWCDFTIQMPLRTEFMGKVDASRAAGFSVEISNSVASGMDYTLPRGMFCTEFIKNVDKAFKSKYPRLGASAVKK
jgi:hypothetical protein